MSTAVSWRTSTYSIDNGNCVEIAEVRRRVLARDSKDRRGPVLTFQRGAWDAFVAGAHRGEFDRR